MTGLVVEERKTDGWVSGDIQEESPQGLLGSYAERWRKGRCPDQPGKLVVLSSFTR